MTGRVPSAALEGLLYAILLVGPFASGCVEPWPQALLLVLCYLLALGAYLRGRTATGAAGAYLWLAPAALAAMAALQVLLPSAADGPRPAWPSTVSVHDTERALRVWGAWAALAWAVPRVVVDAPAARRFARVLFGAGVVMAVFGFLQSFTSEQAVYWVRPAPGMTPFGPYYNKDHAANFLLLAAAMGSGLFISRMHEWTDAGNRAPDPTYARVSGLMAGGALLCLAGALFVKSEAAALALPLGGCAAAGAWAASARKPQGRLSRALMLVGAAAFVVLLVFGHVSAAADAGGGWDRAVTTRLGIYADAWRWWRDAPLFGTGLGSFASFYPAYQDSALRGTVTHAHSDWVELALEAGVLGLLAAAAGAAAVYGAALKTLREGRSREMRALAGGGLVAACFFAAHSLFEFAFQIPGNAAVLVAVAGFVASSAGWKDKSSASRAPSEPPEPTAAWLSCALAVVAAWGALRPAVASTFAASGADPAARLAGQARALDFDADPALLFGIAANARALALSGETPDYPTLRFSLRCALRALEHRPFDAQTLHLAGAALWRLRREGDAAELAERARRVSFAPLRGEGLQRRRRPKAKVPGSAP